MRNQFQLHDAGPLDILVAALVGLHAGIPWGRGALYPCNPEIPELLGFAIKGADVPAQPIVDQSKRHDFALGATAGNGVIFDGQGPLLVNGPGDGGQYVQIRMREPGWDLTGYPRSQPGWFAVPKPLGQPSQDPLGLEVKNGFEVLAEHVVLGFGVVVNIAWRQFLVDRQIPRGSGRLDAEARYQILAADIPNEAYPQFYKGKAVALWLGKVVKLFVGHFWDSCRNRGRDCFRKYMIRASIRPLHTW